MNLNADTASRLFVLSCGSALVALGVAALVHVDLGADAYSVLIDGLAHQTGIAFGTAATVVGLVLVAAAWLARRRSIGPAAIVQPVITGQVINLVLPHLPRTDLLVARGAFCAVGVVLIGVGVAAYLGAGLGRGPQEAVVDAIASAPERFAVTFNSLQALMCATGWALGGTVGFGTLLAVVGVGPVAAFVRRCTAPASSPVVVDG